MDKWDIQNSDETKMADRHLPNARRPRHFFRNDRLIDDIDAEERRRRYRFTLDNIDWLLGLIGHRRYETMPWHRDTVYATGAFLQIIGDCQRRHCYGVEGCYAGDRLPLRPKRRFPTTDRHKQLKKGGFHAIAGFPSVISAVNGTHIRIIAPYNYEEN